LSIRTFTGEQDCRGACRTHHLCALAGNHFHAVDGATDRDVADRQGVASANGSFAARHQLRADLQATRGNDVAALAVGIAQQRNMRSTVGVVFNTLYLGYDSILVATEIDETVVLLVTTTAVTRSDVTVIVAARILDLFFQQGRIGRALVQVGVYHLHHRAPTRRGRLQLDEWHLLHLLREVDFLAFLEGDIGLALIATAT